ncbi:MAG TPA: radical SAM family heme chaperone HemW [Alphaproteobacteria bacterium]|nr:radical SAM family heme chaperone HemW [Alphaproteobacteria bacterium]
MGPASNASAVADAGFGVYVHWPFCLAKCPYCDFNSHVRDRIDQARWRNALLSELDHFAAHTAGRTVTSVFFGGGTPSLMAPETVAAVLDRIARHWRPDAALEVTLEANPTSVEAGRFSGYAGAGVNRISLGVQALDDAQLRFLGRRHSRAEALAALALARRNFTRVSFDLIYARPNQTPKDWQEELRTALEYVADHVSLYQLTIEAGTSFEQAHARGDFAMPDEDTASALYESTAEILGCRDLHAYEISNYARPGAECRHNLTYWRYGDYVGVGPGAHGRLTIEGEKIATRQHRAPERWLESVERSGHATRQRLPLTREERFEEMLMMGLRLSEGVGRERVSREFGSRIEALVGADRLAILIEGGFLVLDERSLRATASGRQRLDAVLASLIA